jgi:hypothetical protein
MVGMVPAIQARLSNFPAIIHSRFRRALLVVALANVAAGRVSAEIVFQDFFTSPAGNITNSVPWIDVQGKGWQAGGGISQLAMDGNGHLYNSASNAAVAAGVQLIPIGPHGSLTASAIIQLPAGSTESIDLGYCDTNGFLTASASGSGPWVQVLGTGTINYYGTTMVAPG